MTPGWFVGKNTHVTMSSRNDTTAPYFRVKAKKDKDSKGRTRYHNLCELDKSILDSASRVTFNVFYNESSEHQESWDLPLDCYSQNDFNGDSLINYFRINEEMIDFYHGVLDQEYDWRGRPVINDAV